jgi:Family of unknown function (DUF6338)
LLGTATAVLAAIGLVLPGFIVAELSRIERAGRAGQGDLDLILRALFYALLIQIVALPWTASIVRDVGQGEDWTKHVCALVPYGAVVLLAVPTMFGLGLNRLLRTAEKPDKEGKTGNLKWWHAALGAQDARDAFDLGFGRLADQGRYVIVRRKDGTMLAATFGEQSWAGRAPEPHDLYLEEVRSLSPDGHIGPPLMPPHAVWINADAVDSVFIADPSAKLLDNVE